MKNVQLWKWQPHPVFHYFQKQKENPAKTTTYGTGEMILDALDRGFRDISIAIGGSATNDGGMGCMCALGVRFWMKMERN